MILIIIKIERLDDDGVNEKLLDTFSLIEIANE